MFKETLFQCCKQCRQVMFKGTINTYKNKHIEQHKTRRTTRRNRHSDTSKPLFVFFFQLFKFYVRFLKMISHVL